MLALREPEEHALDGQTALLERFALLELFLQLLRERGDGLVALREDLVCVLVVEIDEAVEVVKEMPFECLVRFVEWLVLGEMGHWEPFERFQLILLVISEIDDVLEEVQLSLEAD